MFFLGKVTKAATASAPLQRKTSTEQRRTRSSSPWFAQQLGAIPLAMKPQPKVASQASCWHEQQQQRVRLVLKHTFTNPVPLSQTIPGISSKHFVEAIVKQQGLVHSSLEPSAWGREMKEIDTRLSARHAAQKKNRGRDAT